MFLLSSGLFILLSGAENVFGPRTGRHTFRRDGVLSPRDKGRVQDDLRYSCGNLCHCSELRLQNAIHPTRHPGERLSGSLQRVPGKRPTRYERGPAQVRLTDTVRWVYVLALRMIYLNHVISSERKN